MAVMLTPSSVRHSMGQNPHCLNAALLGRGAAPSLVPLHPWPLPARMSRWMRDLKPCNAVS